MRKKSIIALLGLGTNVGDNLLLNMDRVYHKLRRDGQLRILDSSHVYQSKAIVLGKLAPGHGDYLNAVLKVETQLAPLDLLAYLKHVETVQFGRDLFAARHASRVMDLDILLYDGLSKVELAELTIPHPRMWERDFVMRPLRDVMDDIADKDGTMLDTVRGTVASYGPNLTWIRGETCKMLAIMNATPDSFSDGGLLQSMSAEHRARELMDDMGADCLDIGGESTRPNAKAVGEEEEIARVLPVIEASLRHCTAISIDTTKPNVARAALDAGASVVNDVTGGDNTEMMQLVASRPGINLVLMHARGTPITMDRLANELDDDICKTVAQELRPRLDAAVREHGIPRWRVIVDPGIGFAKTHAQSEQLLLGANKLRQHLGDGNTPIMIAHSRKRFLKTALLNEKHRLKSDAEPWPSDAVRDEVNLAATQLAIANGADIVRVHLGTKDPKL